MTEGTTKRKYLTHTQAAQARATISSVLSADSGRNFSTAEVAKTIGQTTRTTGQLLGGMARGGLIVGPLEKGNKKWWAWPVSRVADEAALPPPAEPYPAPPTTSAPSGNRHAKAHPPKEVELEAFGITIVLGRNERTGRLRIIIEDNAP